MHKKCTFSYYLQLKCIANLYTLPIHFIHVFAMYRTQKVMKVILSIFIKEKMKIKMNQIFIFFINNLAFKILILLY